MWAFQVGPAEVVGLHVLEGIDCREHIVLLLLSARLWVPQLPREGLLEGSHRHPFEVSGQCQTLVDRRRIVRELRVGTPSCVVLLRQYPVVHVLDSEREVLEVVTVERVSRRQGSIRAVDGDLLESDDL